MLWYLVFVFILGLVDEVFGWKHVASEDFQKVVERNDLTLVACKCMFSTVVGAPITSRWSGREFVNTR